MPKRVQTRKAKARLRPLGVSWIYCTSLHLHRHARHFLAGLCTAAANRGAFLHLRVVAKLFAAFRAARTRLSAHAANLWMQV